MNFTLYQSIIILIFVATGALNTLGVKFQDLQKAEGRDGETRFFNHPFIQSNQMFFGMFFNLVVFKILYYAFKRQGQEKVDEHKFTTGNRDFNALIFWLPALCDMVGTSITYVALNLTYASSFQMLRGAVIVFTAVLSYCVFRRLPNIRESFGILLVIMGLVTVGVSDYIDQEASDGTLDTLLIVIGDLMVICSQFLTATQVILEEKFVVSKNVPPLQAVGWEGFFGFCTTAVLMIPFCFIYIGEPFAKNSKGTLEDVVDGYVQIYNNWKILLSCIVTIISLGVYNFCGVTVSKELSCTTRKVLDSLRTIIVWAFSITLLDQKFQYVQLIGFIILLFGMAFYNDLGCTKLKEKLFPPKQVPPEEE